MRYTWLDYLRGIAALWMIEVHVVDIGLSPAYHAAWWFPWLSLTHGFVAVAFLFCAGGAFAITLERKYGAFRRGEKPLWNYLAKLALLLAIGYWLHLPAFSLERTLSASANELQRLADCDILQTIAYSSLLALIVALCLRDDYWRNLAYSTMGVVCAVMAPVVWEHEYYHQLPLFLGALIAPQPISKFPLLPFAAYFLAGVVLVPIMRSWSHRIVLLSTLIWTALFVVLLAIGFQSPKTWWQSSPFHVLFRLSGVAALLGLLQILHSQLSRIPGSSLVLLAGRQSLWIYVFHLLVTYGTVAGNGLSTVVQRSLSPLPTVTLILAVAAVTLTTAYVWDRLKSIAPELVRTVVATSVAISALTFIFLPTRYAQLLVRDDAKEDVEVQHAGCSMVAEHSGLPQ